VVPVEFEVERMSLPVKFRFRASSVLFCENASSKLLVTSTTVKMKAPSPIYFSY